MAVFDPNSNPEFDPPYLIAPLPPPNPDEFMEFTQEEYRQYADAGLLNQGAEGMRGEDLRAVREAYRQYVQQLAAAGDGIARTTNREALHRGVYGSGGGMAGTEDIGENIPFESRRAKLFPKVDVPKAWRMRHQKARGGHIAYLGKTEAAYFTRKASANLFVRMWNDMMAHLGSAAEFDQLRLAGLFAAVVQAGSGQQGLANGFKPPMNGQ